MSEELPHERKRILEDLHSTGEKDKDGEKGKE
jgi:hypothetical protein